MLPNCLMYYEWNWILLVISKFVMMECWNSWRQLGSRYCTDELLRCFLVPSWLTSTSNNHCNLPLVSCVSSHRRGIKWSAPTSTLLELVNVTVGRMRLWFQAQQSRGVTPPLHFSNLFFCFPSLIKHCNWSWSWQTLTEPELSTERCWWLLPLCCW